ncbi:MAG: ATP-dependent DNA helicase [Deltaproteobacteria bacterium]|nr:ATP-dependent DNA helicase [Deltaproteobacteria bacterium]
MKAADVLGPGGLLAAAFPGYEHRPGQLDMSARIARAIDDDERLMVEAGTGTGKTLAYLVPAILSGRKVVISTATKNLQDQIARVDLPRLASVMPRPFTWAVMKGLGNYVCRRRLAEYERQTTLVADPAFDRLRGWVDQTASGDRADVPDLPDDSPLWREVASSPETRIGARCAYNDRCFVTGMRRNAATADIVVTNHHLFFADLALRGTWPEAAVLPAYEAVIFDEAHQIEDIAGEFFGVHVSTQRLAAIARDLDRVQSGDPLRAQSLASRLQGTTAGWADALRARTPKTRIGEEVRAALSDDIWTSAVRARYHDLDAVLEELAVWLDADGQTVRESIRAAPELAALGRRAQSARDDLSVLADITGGTRVHAAANVRWIVTGPRGVGIHTAPVDVGPRLAAAFGAHPGAAIFTSATLTVADSFNYMRQRLGLGDTASEAAYPSPFRYDRQALLYVAVDLPEPTHADFPAAAAVRAAELCRITDGRALLLFTSFRNLRHVAAHLRQVLPHQVLVQGERPRHVLLAALREQVGSILLATQSFWEGVDVPGEALSLVVIDRLPFGVPDDPLTAARIHRLRDEGDDPFGAYQLPRAALALKQGFGRLIRTRSDAGIVALLDGRIARRTYGSTLFSSLPNNCPRTESLHDVATFWARVHPVTANPALAASATPLPTEATLIAGEAIPFAGT